MSRGRQREALIAMTQTEIMLVLVLVVLVVLAFKQGQLVDIEARLVQRENELAEQSADASDAPAGTASRLDLEAELTQKLVEFKQAMQAAGHVSGTDERQLVIDSVTKALQSMRDNERLQRELVEALHDASLVADSADATAALQALRQELAQARRELAALEQARNKGTSDLVGFIPCWHGPAPYYFAFDITHRQVDGKFLVSLHRHTQQGGPPWLRAEMAKLPSLREHPAGWIGYAALAEYGARVRAQQQAVYAGTGCKLAITLNKDADGTVVDRITGLGWYPIYR